MALRPINLATNGSGRRKCISWIEKFVEHTEYLECAPIWRKWSAIGAVAATLEQKVWVTSPGILYPNLYIFLVGAAGTGKTKAVVAATNLIRELPEAHIAPTSVTMAALVDHLVEAKRTIIHMPNPAVEYNSILISADELSAFMHEYGNEMIAGLTTFFDVVPYGQARRTGKINITIQRPQINIISGTTPSNLMRFVPPYAWEQGFTSRVILVYSDDRPIIDAFNTPAPIKSTDLIHDLYIINTLSGQFDRTDDYAKAMHNWKLLGFPPEPQLPQLKYYCNRRFSHLIKLSMIACVDRCNELVLTVEDFNKAMGWLLEAEAVMPFIFDAGAGSADSNAMDEIYHFVKTSGEAGVSEHKINNFARKRVMYANAVPKVLEVMERSGMIRTVANDPKTGMRIFTAGAGL